MWVMGCLWQCLNWLRAWLYRQGVLKAVRLDRPVISIGNLALGGRGKTPLTIALCDFLQTHHRQVTVLSRGYGHETARRLLPLALDASMNAAMTGDEPLLIKRRTGAAVWVDGDRIRAARAALRAHHVDCFVLDDGFSHLKLQRDLDIVCVATEDFAPFALRRESLNRLRDADVIVVFDEEARARVQRQHIHVPILMCHRELVMRAPSLGGQPLDWDALRDQKVVVMTAIASPLRLLSDLQAHGVRVVQSHLYRDHAPLPPRVLAEALRLCEMGEISAVVVTEKDAVKLTEWPHHLWVAELSLQLPAEMKRFLGHHLHFESEER